MTNELRDDLVGYDFQGDVPLPSSIGPIIPKGNQTQEFLPFRCTTGRKTTENKRWMIALRAIGSVAAPVSMGLAILAVVSIIELIWISKLGGRAMAGVGAVLALRGLIEVLLAICPTGGTSLVGRAIGERQFKSTTGVATSAIAANLCIGLILSLCFYAGLSPAMSWMGLDAGTREFAIQYGSLFVFLIPILATLRSLNAIYYGLGESALPNIVYSVAIILGALIEPIAILGAGKWHGLGVRGAVLVMLITHGVTCAFLGHNLWRRGIISMLAFMRSAWTSDLFAILRIGAPIAAADVVVAMIYPILTAHVSKYGTDALAGLTLAQHLETLPYLLSLGCLTSTSTFVAQYFGRKDFQKIEQMVRCSWVLLTAVLCFLAGIFLAGPVWISTHFVSGNPVIEYAALALMYCGVGEVFIGWQVLAEGILSGLGKTRPYFVVSLLTGLGTIALMEIFSKVSCLGIHGVLLAFTGGLSIKGVWLLYEAGRALRQERSAWASPTRSSLAVDSTEHRMNKIKNQSWVPVSA
ncbi:MAG TPA: MATE family efflux transporter [Elusimicrobiota bacterium]|nr:MATE family efflux transporter [Elusimicrobiota bacterium]